MTTDNSPEITLSRRALLELLSIMIKLHKANSGKKIPISESEGIYREDISLNKKTSPASQKKLGIRNTVLDF